MKGLSQEHPQYSPGISGVIESQLATSQPRVARGDLVYLQMDTPDDEVPTSGKTRDSSGNGNHATKTGSPTLVNGAYGKAYNLDGNTQELSIVGGIPTLSRTNVSVAMWINHTALNPSEYEHPFGLYEAHHFTMFVALGSNDLYWKVSVDGNVYQYLVAAVTPGTNVHVAMTYDGTTFSIYLNGALSTSQVIVGSITGSATGMVVGGTGGAGDRFNGTVAKFHLSNQTWTAAEVLDIYTNPYRA